MTVLHVQEQGAVVRRTVELIKVTKRADRQRKETLLRSIPVHELEQVVVYGNVQLTTQAAALLLQKNVDVVFLSFGGKFLFRMVNAEGGKFGRLRQAQLALSGDEQRSLAVAKAVVRAKLANQRNLLQRLGAGAAAAHAAALTQAAQTIDQMRTAAARATDADSLRGFEGRAAATYFGSLKPLLEPRWAFQGRAFHPPPDAFNALLSFGYALLLKDVTATLQIVGLDPYMGCFHALEYGRPSLTLDLMEEFRPLVVDEMALGLVLAGKLKPEDFTQTGQAEQPVLLGAKHLSTVITAYEQRLDTVLLHKPSESRQKLRRCFELQARIYARVVLETRSEYEGLVG
ncbi:MAG: CRISPR-associated endonuclease Cas1 [Caldilineaceae bacterium]